MFPITLFLPLLLITLPLTTIGQYITPESFADAIAQRDHLASAVTLLQGNPVSFAEFVFLDYLCRDLQKIRQYLLNQEQIARQ